MRTLKENNNRMRTNYILALRASNYLITAIETELLSS